ncbi:DUF7594 domain-containing protein [Cerasicoccus frondis]|uniref:CBM96 family carbohydrate-binding protein n=1 Tax=Cerasicoccus frondis TaxID=490090 RepID=UPI002852CCFE|nr:family 16 glycosylhydrolase [Cerasicoccus frondis]
MNRHPRPILLTLALPLAAFAADIHWHGGAGDDDFNNGLNWTGTIAPANDLLSDTAVFDGTPSTQPISIPAHRQVYAIEFESGGWQLGGANNISLADLSSDGIGENKFSIDVKLQSNASWAIGNTLVLDSVLYQYSDSLTIRGGGELVLASRIKGIPTSGNPRSLHIKDATVFIDDERAYPNYAAGAVYLEELTSCLILQATLSEVENWISQGDIVDAYGDGLALTNDPTTGLTSVMPQTQFATEWIATNGNGDFNDALNWDRGEAPDADDFAVFSSTNTGAPGIVNLPSSQTVFAVDFQDTGWTLSSASQYLQLMDVFSAGSGVSTFDLEVRLAGASFWVAPEGNTLSIADTLTQVGNDLTVDGGGRFEFAQRILGINSNGDTWGLYINEATVSIADNKVFPDYSTGIAFFNNANAVLELEATTTQTQALIDNGRIIDLTGLGFILNDIGNGWTEVTTAVAPPIAGNWQLEFFDNFEGTELDGDKWRLGTMNPDIVGIAELSPGNVELADGKLRLSATVHDDGNGNVTYTSAQISTFKKYRQQYGYFEARMRYPVLGGFWPAFWMMPDRGNYGRRAKYFESFLKFDLSGIDPSTIASAELRLHVASLEDAAKHSVCIMELDDDSWSESTLTWNNKPAPKPIWIERIANEAVVGADMIVDVSDYILEQAQGDQVVSFVLSDQFMTTKEVSLHTREATDPTVRPRLIIDGVTHYPIADTHAHELNPDTNYGSAALMTVCEGYANTASTKTIDGGQGMEIDIMEHLGVWGPDTASHALHWDGYNADHKSMGSGELEFPSTESDFHVYGVYWDEALIEFYIDGVKTFTWGNGENEETYDADRIMNIPAYLILTLQLGGWDGNLGALGSHVDGQYIEVDWVRAWSGTPTNP